MLKLKKVSICNCTQQKDDCQRKAGEAQLYLMDQKAHANNETRKLVVS